jgi:hypothetical protein
MTRKARIEPQDRWPDIPVAIVVPVDPVTHQARRTNPPPMRVSMLDEVPDIYYTRVPDCLEAWKCPWCGTMYETRREAAHCAESHP